MLIEIPVGSKVIALQGGSRAYELCEQQNIKDPKTGIVHRKWVPFAFYPGLEVALKAILNMKIRRSDASTLKELIQVIKQAKEELKGTYQ